MIKLVDINALLVASSILIPIVTSLVQSVKALGVNSFYAPLFSIGFGIAIEFLAVGTIVQSPSVGITILLGIVVGLSASGLYSGAMRIKNNEDPMP